MLRAAFVLATCASLAPPPRATRHNLQQHSTLLDEKERNRRRRAEELGFWDEARLDVSGGDGGDGCLSFRREKYVAMGGPNGGNGARGGSVIVVCDRNLNTLGVARRRRVRTAERGQHGRGSNKHARAPRDSYIRVPPGTVVREASSGKVAGELRSHGDALLVARGGRGGRGNAAFKTARRTAPRIAERGERGASRSIVLELQLVADVGLVGLPNAGKSTLLRSATAANPKVADYAFTTLVPNLGVWEPSLSKDSRKKVRGRRSAVGGATKNELKRRQKLRRRSTGRRGDKRPFVDQAGAAEGIDKSTGQGVDAFADRQLDAILDGAAVEEPIQEEEETREEEKGLVICDIPGLVDKASQGVGLGDAFLKHVERCACLLHVVDASRENPCEDYDVISRELESYSDTLAKKPRVVLLNKVDALDASREAQLVQELRAKCKHTRVATASALSGKGVDALMTKLRGFVDKHSTDTYAPVGERVDLDPPFANSPEADSSFTITDGTKEGYAGQWRVDSPRLEKIAAMTKFDQPDAVARFGRVVEALGVAAELESRGAVRGDLVMIGDDVDLEYDPVGWSPYSELKQASEEEEEEVYEEGEFLDYDGEVLDDYEEESYGDEDFLFLLDGDS